MTAADITVGGRTRANWGVLFRDWMGLTPDLVALLDAAFDSRGLREGLERAAKWHDANAAVFRKNQAEIEKSILKSGWWIDREDMDARQLEALQRDFENSEGWHAARQAAEQEEHAAAALRAEASKLDGEPSPRPPHWPDCPDCPDCPPEPPAEERRDAHTFVVGPVPDYCHFTAGGGRCNQSRAWHEPAR
jgi:hypothetical protein